LQWSTYKKWLSGMLVRSITSCDMKNQGRDTNMLRPNILPTTGNKGLVLKEYE